MALFIIILAIIMLVAGYIFYGAWLAKQWGIDPKRKTPAEEKEDGIDYAPTNPAVLMGHHFSSVAGAGPINGPIQAAVFGWVPVFLWCIIGGIFFGGVQDLGSLLASVRNDGKTVGEIVNISIGPKAKRLFLIIGLIVCFLTMASFVNIVSNTFFSNNFGIVTNPNGSETSAIISIFFIALAIIYGLLTNRAGIKAFPATLISVVGIIISITIGLHFGLALNRTTWIVLIGLYVLVASKLPVWFLLQPRDYLSSFLLYALMIAAVVGVVISTITGNTTFELPAFTSWHTDTGYLFPMVFITVACGACSGFHSIIISGTTSKQLDNERNAKPIAYGSMLIESALGIIAVVAVGMVWNKYQSGGFDSPTMAFAAGVGSMFGAENSELYSTIYALLSLAVSIFALTTLDTTTRLVRLICSELFLLDNEKSWKDAKGIRKILANPYVNTTFVVLLACILGELSLTQIWGLFGAANQILAALALMSLATWFGNIGKNNKMFYIPTVFMFAATFTYLGMKIVELATKIIGSFKDGTGVWGPYFQLGLAIFILAIAIALIVETAKSVMLQRKKTNIESK